MKPKQFDFIRAETLDEALEGLAEYGAEARILAGGQSQVAMLNFRLIEATVLIDINRLDELDYIRNDNGAVEIGAATRQEDLLEWPQLAETVPLLAAAIPNVGHFQTRNRGTVCGSIAHSDPVSELPLVLATTDGEVVLQSKRRRRVVKAAEFQIGLLSTSREPDEMVIAVRFPHGVKGTGYAFDELSRRKGDLAVVSVAAVVSKDGMRLGVGGVADCPTVRDWPVLDDNKLEDALNAFAWDLGGFDDVHGTSQYRRELVRRMGFRTIKEAKECQS